MSCTYLLRTQAFLDGELDAAPAAEAEAHVADCPECQSFTADAAALSDAIRSSASRYWAPPSLRAEVRAKLGAEVARAGTFSSGNRRGFWVGAAGGAGVTALAAVLALIAMLPPSADTLAESVANAHVRALMSGPEIEVVSTSHHTVKPWFAGRVPLSPPVQDLGDEGFQLVGGRVDELAGTSAAVVVYRHGQHMIDLFVWADRGATLPREAISLGYRTIFWKRGDLDFAAVSDMDAAELRRFTALVRSRE